MTTPDCVPRPPNDFHIALLWLRSLEICIGHPMALLASEIGECPETGLFATYRSPFKA